MTGLRPLLVVLAATPVHAEPSAVAKAQAYLDLAGRLYDARDFAGALSELERAEPLMAGDPAQSLVRFNIARCLEELGRPAEAALAYERYLVGADDERRRQRARAALERLLAERLGVLAIRCTPAAARVQVVGASPLICPVELRLAIGRVEVDVAHEGFDGHRFSWEVRAGARTEGLAELQATAPSVPAAPVTAPPAEPSAVPAFVRAEVVAPASVSARPPAVPIALLVAGGGLALTGGALHFLAYESDTASDTFETRQSLAIGGYAVGAAVASLGLWLLLDE